MRSSKWLILVGGLISSVLGTLVALLSFLTGGSRATPGPTIKKWDEFEQSCPRVNSGDVVKFAWACHSQLSGNHPRAQTLYNDLLERYPDNPVVLHNLRILE